MSKAARILVDNHLGFGVTPEEGEQAIDEAVKPLVSALEEAMKHWYTPIPDNADYEKQEHARKALEPWRQES